MADSPEAPDADQLSELEAWLGEVEGKAMRLLGECAQIRERIGLEREKKTREMEGG